MNETQLINEFLKWIETRNLSICNCSNGKYMPPTFWPVDTDGLASKFRADRMGDFWATVRTCPHCDEHGMIDEGPEGLRRCKNHDWSNDHA